MAWAYAQAPSTTYPLCNLISISHKRNPLSRPLLCRGSSPRQCSLNPTSPPPPTPALRAQPDLAASLPSINERDVRMYRSDVEFLANPFM